MSIPYIPLYVTDYEADTAHLTIEEDGAYLRLLRLCWRTPGCSVPSDPRWIMRKMRVSADDYYRVVEPIIEEFFTVGMDRVFNARLQAEHERINETHKKRSDAGARGNEKRWVLKTNDKADRPATVLRSQLEPELEPELKPKKERKNLNINDHFDLEIVYEANPYDQAFDEFWVVVPKKAGKVAAKRAFIAKVTKAKIPPEIIIEGMKRYAKLVKNDGRDRSMIKFPQGWINDERWNDEAEASQQDFSNKLKEKLRAGNSNPDAY